MAYETILSERDGAVITVTLNRPKVLNVLNSLMIRELGEALAAIDGDRELRAVVITGAGERAFAAGADIAELAQLPSALAAAEQARRGQELTLQIERLRVVVIAAVNGFALGGGCELAMACDIRIASERAKFGQPEVNLGLMPGYGGTQRSARLLGRGTAMYLCLSGELIDAEHAKRIGLVEEVVAAPDVLPRAKGLAALIAAKAPLAVAATKRTIREGSALAIESGLALEALQFGALIGTRDFSEGTTAFLEKRPPVFHGI